MKTQRPTTPEDMAPENMASKEEHRVLQFRPRTFAHPPGQRGGPAQHEDTKAERPVALRAQPGRTGRFPPSHAGQHCGLRIYRRADGDRNMACHEHCGSAQDPGLRADGPPRLCAHYHTAYLADQGPPAHLAPNPTRRHRPPPLNSERGSDIRALDSGWWTGHSGALAARLPGIP